MSKPHNISDAEWQARCELAALYRMVAHFRMTDLIDTHITLRIPGPEHHFLINQYGVIFDRMRASDLVRIDQHGNVVDEAFGDRRVNAAGFVIHSAIHMARPDMQCVIHTHTSAGIAVSAQEQGLLPISQHALKFYGKLAYHQYEGIALSLDERERLIADLGTHKAMILRNHGLLAGGASVAEAFHEIHFLERACQAQVHALSGGSKLVYPSEEVCRHTAAQFQRDESAQIISLSWDAALTLIEHQRESYCS
ncbi:class II aldolase/adducin family protein [Pseudomonas plecoglossicida]|jgi:ribulose-5-phosphate 4-epimerase/fuculose-1-phosphate aldolase|uniref:Aldolase II superfamily protein n=1 Tax=Pseudomonas putida TRO1 TaxID=1227924 RepID=A0AAD2W9P9_PSEPU|nr:MULTISPECIES: class II aldolase/adducin family protein [Pseudomonas]ANI35283.1 aldolase [Pseudomonas sp. JY-Q]EKT4503997.1 class II aldolase/adducin family protein [Pseudomonas putida]EKT4539808.1 class II aldolase/adducin family protein [Pseudomonas putida]EKT4565995.1 class II aldolase/adducin family protein [Pseudomonas putida]ELS0923050.1 class II aldolase/adducin family protein [Pseudomonas putida]